MEMSVVRPKKMLYKDNCVCVSVKKVCEMVLYGCVGLELGVVGSVRQRKKKKTNVYFL